MRLSQCLLVLLIFIACAQTSPAAKRPDRPNIVVLFADDLGYADVGCFGANDIATPNIDRLAAEGTRFTNFCVAQPVCTASRAALMSGCYPNRVGLSGALNHTSAVGINPAEQLLPELLKARGYATGIFGKWHLGHHPAFLPTRNGFDEFAGLPYSNDNGPLHPVVRDIPPLPWYENEAITERDPDQSQFTKRLTDRAIDFITRHRDEPFFLYVPHIMPHVPIFATKEFQGTSQRGLYGDVVQELDHHVGRFMTALRDLKLDDRTLVIFLSDNGPFLSYGEHAGSAVPFREGKLTTFEGGVRVPCAMRWPGQIPAGRVCDELITGLDLLPTLTELAGANAPKKPIDGQNLLPVVLGQPEARGREVFFYFSGTELHAVRRGHWKLHVPHEYLTVAAAPGRGGKPSNFENMKPKAIEESGIKGIASRHGYRVESLEQSLFDLLDDPGETKNVAAQHPDIVRELLALAAQARADLGDPLTQTPGTGVRPSGDVRPKLPPGVKVVSNQTYAARSTGALLLDLYLPVEKPAQPLPVVLWIHGGGWSAGAKENCPAVFLAGQGFAVASLNYRLTQVAQWPAQIDDCRDAVRWLRSNADRFGLDAHHIGAWGGSAGGHLAALLGTLDAPARETVSSRVQAVCDWYGPTDLLSMPPNVPGPDRSEERLARSNGPQLLGGVVHRRPEQARAASALHQVSTDDPPFLIMHGDRDPGVPLDQSQRLADALRTAKVTVELVVLKEAGHGGPAFQTPEVRARVRQFFQQHLALK